MLSSIVLLCFVLIFIFPATAYAYLDPATGSLLVSLLIGVIATVLFMLKKAYYDGSGLLLGLFGKKHKKTSASLIFYNEGKQYWNVFKPLLDALSALDEKSVYLTSDSEDPALQYTLPGLTTQYIGKGDRAFAYLNLLEADVCVMTTPGLDTLQIKRSPGVKHYMHIVHALGDTSMYRMYALDYYDSICTSGDYQKTSGQELEKLRSTKAKIYFQSGCAYYDEMIEKKRNAVLREQVSEPPCILVAPTWSTNGLLSRYGDELLLPLAKAGYEIVIRPHPQSLLVEPELIERLQKTMKAFSNVSWDFSADNFETMLVADVLISDYSGVIYDFAFVMERPVLTMDFIPSTDASDAADLESLPWDFKILEKFGKRINLHDVPKIPEIVAEMVASGTFKADLVKLRAENVFNFGCAGPVIAQQILEVRNAQRTDSAE